jgi:hypothetical protein
MALTLTPGKPLPAGQTSMYEQNRPGTSKKKVVEQPVSMNLPTSNAIRDAFFNAVPNSGPQIIDPNAGITPSQAFFGSSHPQSIDRGMSTRETPQAFQTPQNQPATTQQQGAQSSPQTQQQGSGSSEASSSDRRMVTITQKDGRVSTFSIDPKYSYISQTGQYEHDFWTKEGQRERILNAIDTAGIRTTPTAFKGKYIPGASEVTTGLIDALNVATILSAGAGVFKAIAGMNKVGSLALTANGAKELASTIPEASGVYPWLAKTGITGAVGEVGAVASNTKTAATGIKAITQALFLTNLGKATIGGIILSTGLTGSTQVRKEVSDYIKNSGEMAMELREVGMNDLADELAASNKDLKDGFDVIIPYIPYLGKNIEMNKIQGYTDRLNEMNLKYEAAVKKEKEEEIMTALETEQQAAEVKREQDLADTADERAYEEKQDAAQRPQDQADLADKRAYEEAKLKEQRAYDEEQARIAEERRMGIEGTATETAQGSTLTFGLLNTSGAVEFVDKDKASNVYFGKTYEELTPEQKMLLNLLKGG